MQIVPVTDQNSPEFARYCRRYGPEHDSSYSAIEKFQPSSEYPAYLLLKDGEIAGAVCLLTSAEYRHVRSARFMIFHVLESDPESYNLLLQAAFPHLEQFDTAYAFIPFENSKTRAVWESLGFKIERSVYLLQRGDEPPLESSLPEDFQITAVEQNDQAALNHFRTLWNRCYAAPFGFVGVGLEEAQTWFDDASYLPGGLMLLRRGSVPVGTVSVYRDEEGGTAFIDNLSVASECRSQGLGRLLLRQAVLFAQQQGFRKASLTVNATNERALRLYLSERFSILSEIICYNINGPAGRNP